MSVRVSVGGLGREGMIEWLWRWRWERCLLEGGDGGEGG